MLRRDFLAAAASWIAAQRLACATPADGQRLASAARSQIGVTTSYDPTWAPIPYPGGDVPRSTGVCADVIIRAARDALSLDLQKLVHEDMLKNFDAYPARKTWRQARPDANVDHRRVLNLQTYFQRAGAQIWRASARVAGDAFPEPLQSGDILSWLLNSGQPHIGIVVAVSAGHAASLVHNIGRGAEELPLSAFWPHQAAGHYRWPAS